MHIVLENVVKLFEMFVKLLKELNHEKTLKLLNQSSA